MAKQWGFFKSLLVLAPVFVLAPLEAYRQHHALPNPVGDLSNPTTGLPQISESYILNVSQHLSESIGYRTVGTKEHALGDAWLYQLAREECAKVSRPGLECEVWRQEGSGNHRFDIMNTRLYKSYVNLSNIVIRLSNGTPEGKTHAVLVNSHLDSSLPGPGAADDAISVGVMLDVLRVLRDSPDWHPTHSVILLFNNAEESLQDGSHLYSTQHHTAPSVRAMINLEAAGTSGREILFQATSEEMIDAYSRVPRPFGTIFANDIFSTNVLQSDTDFRQFQLYLNVTGLDMALIGNGYLYHMRKDLVQNFEPGVAQNMGENTLALLQYLSSSESPLPSLTQGYTKPTTVYYSHLGRFWIYSFTTAKLMHSAFFFGTVAFLFRTPDLVLGALSNVAGFFGGIVGANVAAFIMSKVLGKSMSWFSHEWLGLGLFGPPALLGALASQILFPKKAEKGAYAAILLMQSSIAFGVQLLGIGSAALFFMSAVPQSLALASNSLWTKKAEISLATYALGSFLPLLVGALVYFPVAEVFVPLMGRAGDVPADNVLATLHVVLLSVSFPLIIPFANRFDVRGAVKGLLGITVLVLALYATFNPYDAMHQRRAFALRVENITSHQHSLQMANADSGPGFDDLVHAVAQDFSSDPQALERLHMDLHNPDWDPLFPFTLALSPYKMPLSIPEGYKSPYEGFHVEAVNDLRNEQAGTRTVTLKIVHPGLIWTVIAFDAHVIHWTLDNDPPVGYMRHHVKEASFYGEDVWSVTLTMKLSSLDEKLGVNFMGLQEQGMYPGKRDSATLEGNLAMELFGRLDGWIEARTQGSMDVTLLGAAAGYVEV